MCYLQKSRVPSNVPEEEADDAYGLLRDRQEDDDEDCGNFNDGHDDDDGVPFSRLQGERFVWVLPFNAISSFSAQTV